MLNTKRKDSFRTIGKTLPRFLAIVVMLMLAVGFYTGLQSAGPSMLETTRTLIQVGNLPDGNIQSSYGLNQADLDWIEKNNPLTLQAMRNIDAVMEDGGAAIRLYNTGDMDTRLFRVEDGRLPQSKSEIALDQQLLDKVPNLKLGDWINLEGLELDSNDNEDREKIDEEGEKFPELTGTRFKLVAFLDSPLYLSKLDRGYRLDGKGSLDGFAVISPDDISDGLYTDLFYWDEHLAKETVFSDSYNKASKKQVDKLKDQLEKRAEIKSQNKKKDLLDNISDKEKDLQDGLNKLDEARMQLDDGHAKIKDGRSQIQEAKNKLDQSRKKLSEKTTEYNEKSKLLADQKAQWEDKKHLIEQKKSELEAARSQLDEAYQKMEAGKHTHQKQSGDPDLEVVNKVEDQEKNLHQDSPSPHEAILIEKEQAWQAKSEELKQGQSQLDEARRQLDSGQAQLKQASSQLDLARKQIEKGQATILEKEAELKEKETELTDKELDWKNRKKEAKEAEDNIKEAKDKIENLPEARFIVTGRPDFSGYRLLENNAGKINQIADVFPLIFFALAIFIAYITMARMGQEEEIYMGTMAQMGYSRIMIMEKFIIYALLASLFGSALGLYLGEKVILHVVIEAYQTLHPFNHPEFIPQTGLKITVTLLAVLSTLIPAIVIPTQTLRRSPASLVNQRENTKATKRVRLGSRFLNLKSRWLLRNSFGKIGQAFLVIIAVGASTALIVTGFGIKDSLNGTITAQVDDILHCSGQVRIDEDSNPEHVLEKLLRIDGVSDVVSVHTKQVNCYTDAYGDQSVNLLVPTKGNDLEPALSLRGVTANDNPNLNKSKVLASPTIYEGRNSKEELLVKDLDHEEFLVPVAGQFENYVWHLLVMTPDKFTENFNEDAVTNAFLVNYESSSDPQKIEEEIIDVDGVQSLLNLRQVKDSAVESMSSLQLITAVLVVAAGALALVILYNLINITVNERLREIATLKVLGLFTHQLTGQVLLEVLMQAIPGLILGSLLGWKLSSFIIGIIKRDDLAFKAMIEPSSYLCSLTLAILFIILVMLLMARRIHQIDKVEALKGRV